MESIKLEALPYEIEKAVKSYSKDVELAIIEKLDYTADQILNYIKENAPRTSYSKDHLGDSFIKETYGEGVNKTIVIYSKTKGSIVHLVELGFKHRSGKLVSARPFLRPAYDEFAPKMVEDMKRIIEGGS
ncbi:MAG: HK97 gp10 family phage protein [Clostridia bacterium]|nr:HK97 gp10 family phage protein [Clostridia bacterium]